MPSIEELAAATGVSDDDELPVSQSGTVRRATRAQILAGVQPQLVLAQGDLLGRFSAGSGAAEAVLVGANLTLAGGALSAPAPYSPAALPAGGSVGGSDLVPLVQGGVNVALPYAGFMAGLSALAGFNLSQHRAAGEGAPYPRSFGAILADAATPEEYGAAGDGVTDDTAALAAAIATGRPVRLGPRAYGVRGQWTIATTTWLIGTPGLTRLVRPAQDSGGAWISVQASFEAHGVIFDATCPSAAGTWAVLVTSDCSSSLWADCQFVGAAGPLGYGLCVLPAPDTARHRVWRCEATGNALHGIWIRSGTGAEIVGCIAHGNAGYGLCVDDNDPQLVNQAKRARIVGCEAWGNARGISVGNPNQTNAQPPLWGLLNPDVVGASVEGNRTWGNAACGIAACGDALLVQGNRVEEAGTGLQVQASRSRIAGNQVLGGSFGIDLGGSAAIEVAGNQVLGARVGINPGGGQGVRVQENHVAATEWAITAYAVETDGQGATLGPPASDLAIVGNRIEFGTGGGVLLADGVVDAVVIGNQFTGSDPSQALVPHTASLAVRGNLWNDLPFVTCVTGGGDGCAPGSRGARRSVDSGGARWGHTHSGQRRGGARRPGRMADRYCGRHRLHPCHRDDHGRWARSTGNRAGARGCGDRIAGHGGGRGLHERCREHRWGWAGCAGHGASRFAGAGRTAARAACGSARAARGVGGAGLGGDGCLACAGCHRRVAGQRGLVPTRCTA